MRRLRLLRLLPAVAVTACAAGELVLPPGTGPETGTARAGHGFVRLTWGEVPGAERYRVVAARDPSISRANVSEIPGSVQAEAIQPPLDLAGLTGGPWYFRIHAVRDGLASADSPVLAATPLVAGTGGLVPSLAPSWVATNGDPAAQFGYPATGAGDVDGDGFGDLLVGAMFAGDGGTAFLYLGGPDGLDPEPAWERASIQTGAHFAKGLSSPGDVNGDGWSDLLVAAAEFDDPTDNEGRAWLFHGTGDGDFFAETAAWSEDSDQNSSYMGRFAMPAGDVNGDGLADFAVSQHAHNAGEIDEGRVVVRYGSTAPLSPQPEWMAESNQADAFFGYAMSPEPGDIDADGYDDLVVGAWEWDVSPTLQEVGAFYVFPGGPGGLATVPSPMIEGEAPGDRFAGSVSHVGDVNGDGHGDVLAGAYLHGPASGRVYLYLGGAEGLQTSPAWTYDGTGAERLGMGVGAAGDVNGDGYADLLVGAHRSSAGAPDGGRVLLFLGGPDGPADAPSWEWIGTDPDGWAGGTVGRAGDVNGDGVDDLAIGVASFEGAPIVNGRARVFLGAPAAGPDVSAGGPIDAVAGSTVAPSASFTDAATAGAARCAWDWGDGTPEETVDPCPKIDAGARSHAYAAKGSYVLRIRVENAAGLAGESFTTIRVSP